MSGTYMSAPFVAGVAALVWSVNPNLTLSQVRTILRSTADDLGPSGFDFYYGYGRVNAWKAVKSAISSRDISLTAITPNKNIVGQGFTVNIKVNVTNLGETAENFNVSLYANSTKIQTTTLTLNAGESTSITFTWNTTGYAKGNHTIMAYLELLPNEQDASNNMIYFNKPVTITMPGDINAYGKCDMRDIISAAMAFGASQGNGRWNPNADRP